MPKTYCDLPFEHQYVHMSGSVRLCCATLENVKDKDGKEYHMNNDTQDKHRKGNTWRNLLPDLEEALTKALK